jgi:hypothetical protein
LVQLQNTQGSSDRIPHIKDGEICSMTDQHPKCSLDMDLQVLEKLAGLMTRMDQETGSSSPTMEGSTGSIKCDHDVVVFDDVKNDEIAPIAKILRLTGRVGEDCNSKFGSIYWKPKVIIFTSNFHPREWWKCEQKSLDAFMRRVTNIEEVVYKEPDNHGVQTQVQEPSKEEEFQEEESFNESCRCEEDCSQCGSEDYLHGKHEMYHNIWLPAYCVTLNAVMPAQGIGDNDRVGDRIHSCSRCEACTLT